MVGPSQTVLGQKNVAHHAPTGLWRWGGVAVTTKRCGGGGGGGGHKVHTFSQVSRKARLDMLSKQCC